MSPSRTELEHSLATAKAQRGVTYCLLANLLWPMFPPLFLVLLPFRVFYTYRLANLIRIGYAPIWVVGMFIPFVDLLLLFLLARESSALMRERGFQVGFFGADIDAIRAALDAT